MARRMQRVERELLMEPIGKDDLQVSTLNQRFDSKFQKLCNAETVEFGSAPDQAAMSSDSAACVRRTEQGHPTSIGSNVDCENGAGSQLHHPIGCRTKHRSIQGPTATHPHSN